MANYTSDLPYVLGDEWVPIKDLPYTLGVTEEKGHSFNLSAASTIITGRFYTQDPPVVATSATFDGPSAIMAVYPKGKEDQTGPLKSVLVPCNGGSISGYASLTNAATVAEALARIGDSRRIDTTFSVAPGINIFGDINMNFAFNSFPELAGKRIVRVEFLFSLIQDGMNSSSDLCALFQKDLLSSDIIAITSTDDILTKTGTNFATVPSVDLPRYTSILNDPYTLFVPGGQLFPWTYNALKLLDATTIVNPQALDLGFVILDNSVGSFYLEYAALRVTYCEEQRLLFGGTGGYIRPDGTSVELRAPSMAPGGATLPAGAYTVTIEGDGPQTDLYAIKELYAMTDQPGIVINRPTAIGSTFTATPTDQLVQLSLHTATAAVAGVHGYGRQVAADVYAGNPANTQTVSMANGALVAYPWARYYARRFGNTTQDLILRRTTIPTITKSLTVAAFDALPEITDGWKEVTLKFDSPTPSFTNSGGNNTYEWVTNESAGSRWQILAASAYVKSGFFPLVQITGAQALDETTYGGSSANLTWNGLDDPTSDGTLMFAQEMPPVSGLAVSTASLSVTGVGLDCGVPPECIPTGISYNNVTWTALGAASIPASAFGYYELQRFDAIDNGWNTILHGNSPLVTGFHDYEARIGVESRYRIRFQHRLLFPSNWSAEVANTLPGPGITGNQVGNSAIVFSTNEVQDGGSSLAYTLVWDSTPDESFTFIEAGDVQLQQMYLRDFQTAFRPLERGGERFQRTLLVQAAAVPSGLIRSGFTSLRDLAWDDVSYVCVRNELGDRWYATVLVPSGSVTRNRRLYMAQVDIIEVTGTPSVVAIPAGSGTGSGGACFSAALWDQNPGWDYGCWT